MKEKKRTARDARISRKMERMTRFAQNKENADVDGSYTGMSADGSPPVQDADDL